MTKNEHIKSQFADLKRRAELRRSNPSLRHRSTKEQSEGMLQHVRDMYQSQLNTIIED
ncbi:hypothetical protein ABE073_03895 [Lederbergia citrisecunda]|uniref:hypothetical protein n=1 Tax=Lederbergia citrisecunda TaxID=2833583 RepID=UPI003D291B57